MSPIEIGWTVVGSVVTLLISVGYACVGLVPGDFKRARTCFYLAAALLGAMEMVWYTQSGYSFVWRLVVACVICQGIGIGLPEGLRWVHRREMLVTPPPLPPPKPPNGKDDLTTPSKMPSATEIADEIERRKTKPPLRHSTVTFAAPALSQYMQFSGVFSETQLPLVEIAYVVSGPVSITHRGLHVDVSLRSIEENPALLIKKAVEDFRKVPFHRSTLVFPPGDVRRATGPFPQNPKPLTSEEAAQLNSGRLAICVIGVLHWEDESGSYETTLSQCFGKFPPGPGALMWASFPGDNVEHKR